MDQQETPGGGVDGHESRGDEEDISHCTACSCLLFIVLFTFLTDSNMAGPRRIARPLNEGVIDNGRRYSVAQKAQVLALYGEGLHKEYIVNRSGVSMYTVKRIIARAEAEGFNPRQDSRVLDTYILNKAIPGRRKRIDDVVEQRLIASLSVDRAGREKSSEVLAYEQSISVSSAQRILRRHGYTAVKPTRKPGLSQAQKDARMKFCEAHKNWTLEDWKNVIWSDETSVVIGHRRGAVRIYRRSNEAYEKTAIRPRWKGYSDFMFWGSFSYDKKGPCHIWHPETAAMKTAAQRHIDELNEAREPRCRAEWALQYDMSRLGLRNRPGKRAQWKFSRQNGKLERSSKGGIDWYRYWQVGFLQDAIYIQIWLTEYLIGNPRTQVDTFR